MDIENRVLLKTITGSHPLLNYAVLQNLLKFDKSRQAVLRNRLVCSSWKQANEGHWKRLPKSLILRHATSNETCSQTTTSNSLMTLFDFCILYHNENSSTIRDLMSTTLSQMELVQWQNFVGEPQNTELDLWFWSVAATGWLTKLTITDCDFKTDVPIYKQSFLQAMPNLKILTLKNCVAYPNAVENVNKRHEELYILENGTWTDWLLGRSQEQVKQYEHDSLNTLDIDIKVAKVSKPLKIWNPLLSVFSQIQMLRLGGEICGKTSEGHFHELSWSGRFDRVIETVTHLDLLDFSGKAQEYYLSCSGGFNYDKLEFVAYDIGIFPDNNDSYFCPTSRVLKHVALFRAPFAKRYQRLRWIRWVESVEYWGNVDSSMEFERSGPFGLNTRKFKWNTSCYESKYHGKRIRHLLDASRKAYPLFNKDLFMGTQDFSLQRMANLTDLDIDFGPLSTESWSRLGQHVRGLTTLKAVFGEDQHLELIAKNWPGLVSLELKHRSVAPLMSLQKMISGKTLEEFQWKSCACTQLMFTDVSQIRQVEILCKNLKNVELPWKWNVIGNALVVDTVCVEKQFEEALLNAAKHTGLTIVELKSFCEEIWVWLRRNFTDQVFINILTLFTLIGLTIVFYKTGVYS